MRIERDVLADAVEFFRGRADEIDLLLQALTRTTSVVSSSEMVPSKSTKTRTRDGM